MVQNQNGKGLSWPGYGNSYGNSYGNGYRNRYSYGFMRSHAGKVSSLCGYDRGNIQNHMGNSPSTGGYRNGYGYSQNHAGNSFNTNGSGYDHASGLNNPEGLPALGTGAQRGNIFDLFYSCPYCPRTFFTSQALGGHQNAHRIEIDSLRRKYEPHLYGAPRSPPYASMYSFAHRPERDEDVPEYVPRPQHWSPPGLGPRVGLEPPEHGQSVGGFQPPEHGQRVGRFEPPEHRQRLGGFEPPEHGQRLGGFVPPEPGLRPYGAEPPQIGPIPRGLEPHDLGPMPRGLEPRELGPRPRGIERGSGRMRPYVEPENGNMQMHPDQMGQIPVPGNGENQLRQMEVQAVEEKDDDHSSKGTVTSTDLKKTCWCGCESAEGDDSEESENEATSKEMDLTLKL